MKQRIFISDDRCPVARAAATELIQKGYQVTLNRLGSMPKLPGVESVTIDPADYEALDKFFASCGASLHGVIHVAPPARLASVDNATDEQWQQALQEGAMASMQLTRAAGKHLTALGKGAIIYLGSIHADKPIGHGFLHSMGLASTQMLCKEAALDFGRHNVHCVYVKRGVMDHDQNNRNDLSNLYYSTATRYPSEEMMQADDLNELIAFLLTPGAKSLNGADLRADEGLTMYYGHAQDEVEP